MTGLNEHHSRAESSVFQRQGGMVEYHQHSQEFVLYSTEQFGHDACHNEPLVTTTESDYLPTLYFLSVYPAYHIQTRYSHVPNLMW